MAMTESEARSKIKHRIGVIREIAGNGVDGKAFEDLEIAIQALKEIREYRELGTVEEIKSYKNGDCMNNCEHYDNCANYIYSKGYANAIDEFAERLKVKAEEILKNPDVVSECKKCTIWSVRDIDEIAEKMKGGATDE